MEFVFGALFAVGALFLILIVGIFVVRKLLLWAAGKAIARNRRQ